MIFCNGVKGKSALALSRHLDLQYMTALVLSHKLREAMSTEVKGYKLGGVGKKVEVDDAYFGSYVKPANHKASDWSPFRSQPEKQAPLRCGDPPA